MWVVRVHKFRSQWPLGLLLCLGVGFVFSLSFPHGAGPGNSMAVELVSLMNWPKCAGREGISAQEPLWVSREF
jgi:hypothetical protein